MAFAGGLGVADGDSETSWIEEAVIVACVCTWCVLAVAFCAWMIYQAVTL